MAKDSGMGSLLTLGAVAVGGYFLYENFFATPAVAAAAPAAPAVPPVSTTVTTGGAPVVPAPTPAPVGPSLASIFSNVLSGASTDPNFTGAGDALDSTGYRWNVYTGLALPGKAVPSLPGLDLSQKTGITYDMAGNVVSDLTVSPSTAGTGLNTLTGKVTPAASMSSTTMLAIAAAALVGIILLTGRR